MPRKGDFGDAAFIVIIAVDIDPIGRAPFFQGGRHIQALAAAACGFEVDGCAAEFGITAIHGQLDALDDTANRQLERQIVGFITG